MAKPQTERGFVMIACDLFAAMAVADWPKREWTVLAEILLQVYGPKKRREAHVDARTIEHYTGLSTNNVYRAIRNLKACGVIVETPSGGYRFVKDFECWNLDSIRRLNDGDLRFALSANDRYGVDLPIKKKASVGVPMDTETGENECPTGHLECPTGHRNGAELVSNGTPATIGARAEEDLEIGDRTSSVDDGSRDFASNKVTIKMLVDEARRLFSEGVAKEVSYKSQDILGTFGDRLDCYLAAMREAARTRTKIDRPHRYFVRVGSGYLANGLPPEPASIEPRPAAVQVKPADRSTPPPPPAKAESAGCEHCSGEGQVRVFHPKPDAGRRIPPSTSADCVCSWGRARRSSRDDADNRRIVDLADVLAGRSPWQLEQPEEARP